MNLPRYRNGVPFYDSTNEHPSIDCCCGGGGCYDCGSPGNLTIDFSGLTNPYSGASSGSGYTVWDGVMIPYVTGAPSCDWFIDHTSDVWRDVLGYLVPAGEDNCTIHPIVDGSGNPLWLLVIYVNGSATDYLWWAGVKSRDPDCPDPTGTYTKHTEIVSASNAEEWYNYLNNLPGTQRNPGPASLTVS